MTVTMPDAQEDGAGEDGPPWVPGCIREAAAMMEACARFLAGQDYTSLPGGVLARVVTAMERVDAGQAAVRGKALGAFTAKRFFAMDGHRGTRTWLVHETGTDKPAAAAHVAWARRHEQHPVITRALAELGLTESVARRIRGWTSGLPAEHIAAADEILVTAFTAGATVPDLAAVAAEITARLMPPSPEDEGTEPSRSVRIERTLDGAAVLAGELEPACAALVEAAFEMYGAKQGPEDERSQGERNHDALAAICRDALASRAGGSGKGRAGTALVHIHLADAAKLAGYQPLQEAWTREAYVQWAAENARASVQRGDGGSWLSGKQADMMLRDSLITPVMTGRIDTSVIPRLAQTGHQLHEVLNDETQDKDRGRREEKLVRALLADVIAVLSGPGGYASFLRTHLFEGSPLGGPSLPLDVGRARDVPPQIRKALGIRDRTCAWSGGCDRPAIWTEPHHVIPRSHGGHTSLTNLKLLCWHHHHIVIHQQGWHATLNPDGTLTIRRPDGNIYHPRGTPPTRTALSGELIAWRDLRASGIIATCSR